MKWEFVRTIGLLLKKFRGSRNGAWLSDEDIAVAEERGRIADATEPRAVAAQYDAGTDRICVWLKDGSAFAFSPRSERGLEMATADELAEVKLLGTGSGLHLEALDADLSVPCLAKKYSDM